VLSAPRQALRTRTRLAARAYRGGNPRAAAL